MYNHLVFLAGKGNFVSAFLGVNSSQTYSRIMDFEETDHMTSCSNFWRTNDPCAGNKRIKVASGSLSTRGGAPALDLYWTFRANSIPFIFYFYSFLRIGLFGFPIYQRNRKKLKQKNIIWPNPNLKTETTKSRSWNLSTSYSRLRVSRIDAFHRQKKRVSRFSPSTPSVKYIFCNCKNEYGVLIFFSFYLLFWSILWFWF